MRREIMVNGVITAYKRMYTTNTIQRIMINAICVWESFLLAIFLEIDLCDITKIRSPPSHAK
jgi:hypothetical protein